MEITVIISVVGLLLKGIDTFLSKRPISTSDPMRKRLHSLYDNLRANCEHLEKLSQDYSSKTRPKSLEYLETRMHEFCVRGEELFSKHTLKEEDVKSFQEDVMTTFQFGMTSAMIELVGLSHKEKPKTIAEKTPVPPGRPSRNTEVGKKLGKIKHPTRTFQQTMIKGAYEEENKVRKKLPRRDVAGTSAGASTSEVYSIGKSEQKEDGSVKRLRLQQKENRTRNPNLSMRFRRNHDPNRDRDKNMRFSVTNRDDKIEVVFKGSRELVRAMIGEGPMKVSHKTGYFYYEVELVDMAELSSTEGTSGWGGVGVGLATSKKFKDDKMVGWYAESVGYDGRVGHVYCEQRIQDPCKIGKLKKGDTLGIGVLQLPGQPTARIFFRKNRRLKACPENHGLRESVIGNLHPVVTLASQNIKLRVNFHGSFHLPSGSDLAAALRC